MSMNQLSLFPNRSEEGEGEEGVATSPSVPLSPMKKSKEVESILQQYDDNESKLIALAQIMKKDRKKMKSIKQALIIEIEKNNKLTTDSQAIADELEKTKEEVKGKDLQIVKTFNNYMETYEALLKLRNEKGTKAPRKKSKKKKKDIDMFKDSTSKPKEQRFSVSSLEMSKQMSTDPKKPPAFFNMSGGREDNGSDEDEIIRELEEENKRLKVLIEFKDFELNKCKKEDNFGYECFSDLRIKFDTNLKNLEERNKVLERTLIDKDRLVNEIQLELSTKNEEIQKVENKYNLIIEKQQVDFVSKTEQLKASISSSAYEAIENLRKEIEDYKKRISELEKEKNKLYDEKLKIETIIDKQIEQVEYWTNKANKLEDELILRKKIEEDVTQNLKAKEEEIRCLKLEKEERIIKSFEVQFINIEETKTITETFTKGTVQTCQSLYNSKDYFLRFTYTSSKDKRVKTFKVNADTLGGIIPITDNRAAIQWREESGKNKKQEIELNDPEELLLEIGNLTYR